MQYTLPNIIRAAQKKGYVVYRSPYKLNIIGVRKDVPVSQDNFDDVIAYFYFDDNGKLIGKVAPATTDPGTYFLKNPVASAGAAILKGGQYVNSHKIGTHAGKYTALVQQNPVTVIRDNDRDGYTDFNNKTETGLYGINIHRASRGKNNVAVISKDSAGCQVFMEEADFNEMMAMAQKSKIANGNNFSYTLIDERDYKRYRNTWLVLLLAGAAAVAASVFMYKKLS